jgi:hypothetical protein
MAAAAPRGAAEVMRDEMVMWERIAAVLSDGPKTIPELAVALGSPVAEVTMWVMAQRRYGALEELPKPKAEDYYRYRVVEA